MSAAVAIQLGVAVLCGFLALLHLALWRLVRTDRLHLWLAIALAGQALFSLSLAGSGAGAVGALGWSVPWLALGIVADLPSWIGVLGVLWVFTSTPIDRKRRGLLGVLTAIWIGTVVVSGQFLASHLDRDHMPSWEQMVGAGPRMLPPLLVAVLAGTPLVEGVRLVRLHRPEAARLLLSALAAIAITVLNLGVGSIGGVSFIGLVALPLIFAASGTVLLRYRQTLERQKHAGDYQLVRRLGGGGMGEVYLATRIGAAGFKRPVVLKRILPRTDRLDAAATARLLDEARTAAALVHPNIVAVHDVGRLEVLVDDQPFGWYIAMELLHGVDLDRLIEEARPIPVELAVAITERVCRGLAHAHAQGILHRDISPHNVIVTFAGEVKIVDFGIAIEQRRAVAEPGGAILGKMPYIAPERIAGDDSNPSSDVFAVGVTLYEMLAGQRPFGGVNTMETAGQIMRGATPDPRAARPDLGEAVASIIVRALAPAPADRFADATAMADALAGAALTLPPVEIGAAVKQLCPKALAEQQELAGDRVGELSPAPPATKPASAQDAMPTRRM